MADEVTLYGVYNGGGRLEMHSVRAKRTPKGYTAIESAGLGLGCRIRFGFDDFATTPEGAWERFIAKMERDAEVHESNAKTCRAAAERAREMVLATDRETPRVCSCSFAPGEVRVVFDLAPPGLCGRCRLPLR